MRERRILYSLGQVDGKYIAEAAPISGISDGTIAIRRHRRLPVVLIAVLLAMLLVGAGTVAVIYGDSIQSWFNYEWKKITGQTMSEEQMAVIDHLSQKINISQTVDGVTVTVDSATIGDDNFSLLLRLEGLQFSDHYYEFEEYSTDMISDSSDDGTLLGYGLRYLGLDGDGTALMLMECSYVSDMNDIMDNHTVDMTLSLKNLVQPGVSGTRMLAEGQWEFAFSLNHRAMPNTVILPDTEVSVLLLNTKEEVSVMLTDIELTATSLHFRYDYQEGIVSFVDQVFAVLENNGTVGIRDGNGVPLEDGKIMECSFRWEVPVNPDEISAIQIGDTLITVP